jgi:hypothetical protein
MTVDGQQFEVATRPDQPGRYDVTWISGPDPGYGFSSATSDGRALSAVQLERGIRNFLAQVEPETGYLE